MRLSSFLLAAAASVVFAAAAAPAHAQGAETLTGQVLFDDGLPAPAGITVTLRDAGGATTTTLTTEGGRFTFAGLAAGSYTLIVERACATTVSQAVTVPGAFVTLEIRKNEFVVKGAVTLAGAGGADQSGTTVSLSRSGEPTVSTLTGPLGDFTFADLCGGDYQLAASRRGYLPATRAVEARAPVTVVPTIVLAAASFSIEGTVSLEAGGDASGVTVSLVGTTLTTATGAGGAFRLDAVPAGVYTLRATKSGLRDTSLPALEVGSAIKGLVLHMAAPPAPRQEKAGCAQAGSASDGALVALALLALCGALALRRRAGAER